MEFVEGKTLRQWLAETKRSWWEILEVFALPAGGLPRLMRLAWWHRDFKTGQRAAGRERPGQGGGLWARTTAGVVEKKAPHPRLGLGAARAVCWRVR